ncbi:MAG: hypothetical protein V1896_00030 [Candidatus Zambryskibacteria bacterium]
MQEDKETEKYVSLDDLEGEKKGGWRGKLEDFLGGRYFVPIAIVLVAVIAFSLGRISGLQEKREPVRVYTSPPNPSPKLGEGSSATATISEVKGASTDSSGQVVASKNGTKYHYPWCAGAKQISAKNIITFNSIEEARAAGYTPASNCKGLK